MSINFLDFDTESEFDYLGVYDENYVFGQHLGTYSGDTKPDPFVFNGNKITLQFTSDDSSARKGFRIKFTGKYTYRGRLRGKLL